MPRFAGSAGYPDRNPRQSVLPSFVSAGAKAIQVTTGTFVEATIIASASEDDGEGHWVKHRGRPAVHGFNTHVGADADTALVEEIAITPANVNEGTAGPDALPHNPGDVYADSAYLGNHFGKTVIAKGGTPQIVATVMWGRDETDGRARLDAWNRPSHRIGGRIEKVFGTWRRGHGLRQMTKFPIKKSIGSASMPISDG